MSRRSKEYHARPGFNVPEGARICECGRGWYKAPYTRCYLCNHPEAGVQLDEQEDADFGAALNK